MQCHWLKHSFSLLLPISSSVTKHARVASSILKVSFDFSMVPFTTFDASVAVECIWASVLVGDQANPDFCCLNNLQLPLYDRSSVTPKYLDGEIHLENGAVNVYGRNNILGSARYRQARPFQAKDSDKFIPRNPRSSMLRPIRTEDEYSEVAFLDSVQISQTKYFATYINAIGCLQQLAKNSCSFATIGGAQLKRVSDPNAATSVIASEYRYSLWSNTTEEAVFLDIKAYHSTPNVYNPVESLYAVIEEVREPRKRSMDTNTLKVMINGSSITSSLSPGYLSEIFKVIENINLQNTSVHLPETRIDPFCHGGLRDTSKLSQAYLEGFLTNLYLEMPKLERTFNQARENKYNFSATRKILKPISMVDINTLQRVRVETDCNRFLFLISGGTGGIGGLLTMWASYKCRGRVLTYSRSGLFSTATATSIPQIDGTVTASKHDAGSTDDTWGVTLLWTKQQARRSILLHASGLQERVAMNELKENNIRRLNSSKVIPVLNMESNGALMGQPLHMAVLFSSISSVLGNFGHSNYAAVNAGLDMLSLILKHKGLNIVSIQWGAWSSVGTFLYFSNLILFV